jgi:hypothetical protein
MVLPNYYLLTTQAAPPGGQGPALWQKVAPPTSGGVIRFLMIITAFTNSLYQNTSYMTLTDRPIIIAANRQTINT